MKLNMLRVLSVANLITAAMAVSTQLVKNYCDDSLYLTIVDGSGNTDGPFELPTQQAYLQDIIGEGNDCKVSFDPDIFEASTPVFVLGTSTRNAILYWSAYDVNGDPFVRHSWNVSSAGPSPNICDSTTVYDGKVHACQDVDVTLTINACWLAAAS